MDVTFVRAKDGAPYARLGPAWVGFDEALADAVSPLPPRGSAEQSVSTYWIDRALTWVRRMVAAAETGPFQGGNATTLSVVEGQVVASSDYDMFDPEAMTIEAFEEVLRAWREKVVRVRDEERPQIPATYRRNPYPGDEVSASPPMIGRLSAVISSLCGVPQGQRSSPSSRRAAGGGGPRGYLISRSSTRS